jgi:hypothetical protein
MPDLSEEWWGGGEGPPWTRRRGFLSAFAARAQRALQAETDRWFLWVPVLFAAGIVAYFALPAEPEPHIAVALVLGAAGLLLTIRHLPRARARRRRARLHARLCHGQASRRVSTRAGRLE